MTTYNPDRWVILDTGICIKVFGTWFGGFTSGDEWRLSSGTLDVTEDRETWVLPQHSGSEYILNKNTEGTSGYTGGVLAGFLDMNDQIKVITIEQAIQLIKSGDR